MPSADLKMKDKTVFIISGSDDPYELCDAADLLADKLQGSLDEGLLSRVDAGVDAGTMDSAADFIYERLPLYLDAEDYARLDSLTTPEGIREAVENCHALLSTPAGMVMGRILLRDPLALATDRLQSFNDFSDGGEYELAADIAVETVRDFLQREASVQKVIFNVFKDLDKELYEKRLHTR